MNLTKHMKYLFGGILIGIALTLLVQLVKSKEGYEGQKELLLMRMDGCGYCEKLQPEWDKFASDNDTSITTRHVEKSEDPSLIEKHGVSGYPTILLLDSNGEKLDTYSGKRTASGLLDYCRQNS